MMNPENEAMKVFLERFEQELINKKCKVSASPVAQPSNPLLERHTGYSVEKPLSIMGTQASVQEFLLNRRSSEPYFSHAFDCAIFPTTQALLLVMQRMMGGKVSQANTSSEATLAILEEHARAERDYPTVIVLHNIDTLSGRDSGAASGLLWAIGAQYQRIVAAGRVPTLGFILTSRLHINQLTDDVNGFKKIILPK